MKIVFKGSNWPYALLIKWVTKGEYTHCGIVIDGMVYESKPLKGVIKNKYDPFDWQESIDIEISKINKNKIIKFLKAELGCGYDWMGVARFLLKFLNQSKKKWFCSELVVAALDKVNYFKIHTSPSSYSPKDLFDALV